jgi:diacylglycerol kinase family enzyme
MVATNGPFTASVIAREAIRQGTDLVLVAGGDGTVNEALNGMVPSEVPLAVLPAGTANVLATELRIGHSLYQAAGQLSRWIPRRISVGQLLVSQPPLARYFLLMAGAGFDAQIVTQLNLSLKARHGKLAYWLTGFCQVTHKLNEFTVSVQGKDFACSFALASRVRNYGGTFEIARHASLLNEELAIVLFKGSNPFCYGKYLAGVLSGRLERMAGVRFLRARQMDCFCSVPKEVFVQVDGEAAGRLPVTVKIVPNAVTLLMPAEFSG